ncbi:UDP-N-acetylglucosamine--N-acetylmuramyl-(pentapeptide) pyrophosphoryl-undecaprenol N-acetylglucosamine transferase, partial [Candidatus Woesearchaeota archaeon]|nr:UDP-N-acetylglucosamine--N-acetylmuramyl-(pentapeptide) pyrophosphoryl-undecaprenol N-acetylglucosamine transferase [Candidatus Woesearchaeota archaeon]
AKFSQLFDEDFIMFGSKIEQISQTNLTYYPYKENIFDYMKVCKGVITLAGHLTLSECIAYKKPAMVFPIQDHVEQMLNAYSLEKISYVMYNIEDLRKNLKKFLDSLGELKDRIPQVEFNGSDQVVDIVHNLLT